jgi:hypothetical protein
MSDNPTSENHSSLLDLVLCAWAFYIARRENVNVESAKERIRVYLMATITETDDWALREELDALLTQVGTPL